MMNDITDPNTGQKVTPVVHFKDQTFKRPYQYDSPDLCVELYSGKEKIQINPRLGTKELWNLDAHFSSIHCRDGSWAAMGPRIKRDVDLDSKLVDLSPTLLKILRVE